MTSTKPAATMNISLLQDQTVIIIGGTSGIGRGAAEAAAAAGARVSIAGRDEAKAQRVAQEIGLNVVGYAVDATQSASIEALINRHQRVDHIFFTAANGPLSPFAEQSLEEAKHYLDGHFWGSYVAARAALPLMPPDGTITFLSGGYTLRPQPGRTMIAVAQAAIEGLMRTLAVELAPIRVNVLSPGIIETPLWSGMDEKARRDFFAAEAQRLPARRIGQPSDIGEAFTYLATQGYTTGTVLSINGGWALV